MPRLLLWIKNAPAPESTRFDRCALANVTGTSVGIAVLEFYFAGIAHPYFGRSGTAPPAANLPRDNDVLHDHETVVQACTVKRSLMS